MEIAMLYAHSLEEKKEEEWQPLSDHLRGVADFAKKFADHFNAGDWGFIAGIGHDLGKCQSAFQDRLKGATKSVDHSSPGAKWAEISFPSVGKLMAYAICGHHGGMPDGASIGTTDLQNRLENAICLADCDLPELPPLPSNIRFPLSLTHDKPGFRIAFFIRMLFSCLVDGDFLDTERFCNPDHFHARRGTAPLSDLEKKLISHTNKFSKDTPINEKRCEILSACLENAAMPPGLFSLTVPTGGGKTLSSMAFALKHARIHHLRRVIYVIPFTSIIEQNAKVFRDVLGADAILEHHSNASPDPDETNAQRLLAHRLATENWDAPVVVTTNVQFFESLFSNKPSRCRKLHNMTNAVIILDEAQMLPAELLEPCLAALTELAASYKSSIVFCTATQPALEGGDHFPKGLAPESLREIAPDPAALHGAFRRTRFQDAGILSNRDIADAVRRRKQVLVIVNTRKRAGDLFSLLENEADTFHLSARMCPEHRRQVLAKIRGQLEGGLPCRVIATQLVEAGVDISFPVVFREIAGLDSLCQAAGRCNRNGELHGLGEIFVFTPEDGKIPKLFRQNIAAAQSALRLYKEDPFSPAALRHYFKEAYWLCDSLDEKGILPAFERRAIKGVFPFRTIGETFRLIEQNMQPVLIPFTEKAEDLIAALSYAEHPASLLRGLQAYTVQIYRHEFMALQEKGAIHMAAGLYPALHSLTPHYHAVMGLKPEAEIHPEDLIF